MIIWPGILFSCDSFITLPNNRPIYSFFYLFTIDISATLLFVKIFEPTGPRQDVVTLKASVINPHDDMNLDSDRGTPLSRDGDGTTRYKLITEKHGSVNSSRNEKDSNKLSDSGFSP